MPHADAESNFALTLAMRSFRSHGEPDWDRSHRLLALTLSSLLVSVASNVEITENQVVAAALSIAHS